MTNIRHCQSHTILHVNDKFLGKQIPKMAQEGKKTL